MSLTAAGKKFRFNSAWLAALLSFLLVATAFQAGAVQKKHRGHKKGVEHSMTVMDVVMPEKEDVYISVTFQVSQRVYRLPKDANPKYLKLLLQSQKDHKPVMIRRADEKSDIIIEVKKP